MKINFSEDYIIEVTEDYSPMRKNTYNITKVEKLEGRGLSDAIRAKTQKKGYEHGRLAKLTKAEEKVKICRSYKRLFKKGDEFEIKKGLNILVGDNGCGKSTLIKEVVKLFKSKKNRIIMVDMETTNVNVKKPNPENGILYTPHEIMNHFMWAAESHGETREGVLKSLLSLDFDLLILDEPEQGLSLRNQRKYFNELKALGKDVIIITHSKVFVEESEEIFDVETMKWIKSIDYLETI